MRTCLITRSSRSCQSTGREVYEVSPHYKEEKVTGSCSCASTVAVNPTRKSRDIVSEGLSQPGRN